MNMSEIISKSPAQLREALLACRKEQMHLRFQKSAGQLANPNRWRELKTTVARVKTALAAALKTTPTKKAK